MENVCFICREPATFACSCRFPMTFICDIHKIDHENTPSALHEFKVYPFQVNPLSKGMILEKLDQMIESNKILQKEINENAERKFTEIYNLLNELPERFRSLVDEKIDFLEKQLKELKDIQSFVESLAIITAKNFFTPLEKAMIEPDFMLDLVNLISPAEVIFKKIRLERILTVIPSNLSHIFSHYNYLTDLQEGAIRLKSPDDEKLSKISLGLQESSKILKVSQSSLLITGGEDREKLAFQLDFKSLQRFNVPILNLSRKFHAMAWIDGLPAVIGGNDGMVDMDSVEVLNGNKWEIRREGMKNRRKQFVVTNHFEKVFVAGGGPNAEVYSQGTWEEIVINSPLEEGHLAMFYSNQRLLLFGGRKPVCIAVDVEGKTGILGKLDDNHVETEKSGKDFYFKKGLLKLIHHQKDKIIACKMILS